MAGYIGSKASVVSSGSERKKIYDITTTTTSLTGLNYSSGQVHVFHNGVRLVDGTDYTATNGTSITLTTAADNGDQVVVVSYASYQVSDTVSASVGGTFAGDVSVTGAFTSLGIDDNATSTAVTIDVGGNVGIGISPNADSRIHVYGADVNNKYIRTENNNGTSYFGTIGDGAAVVESNTHTKFTTGGSYTERMRITSTGAVGIGTAAPAFASGKGLIVHNPDAAADTRVRLTNAANGTGLFDGMDLTLGSDGSTNFIGWEPQPMKFYTSGSERMRIDSSGRLLVGTTTANGTITSVAGSNAYSIYTTGGTLGYNIACRGSGTTGVAVRMLNSAGSDVGSIDYTASATTYNTTSDYRLKENVTPIQGASDIIKAMQPVTYTYKVDGSWMDGFLAHELQELHPRAVVGEKDAMKDEEYEVTPAVFDEDGAVVTEAVMGTRSVPDYQGVDYSKLTPILTAALQEALNKIDALEARLTALEATP